MVVLMKVRIKENDKVMSFNYVQKTLEYLHNEVYHNDEIKKNLIQEIQVRLGLVPVDSVPIPVYKYIPNPIENYYCDCGCRLIDEEELSAGVCKDCL